MAGLYFSREEIRGLAGKVARIGDLLSPKERTLLLAIFAAAAASAEPAAGNHEPSLRTPEVPREEGQPGMGERGSGDEQAELGDLQTQLLNAYIPGNSFDSPGRYNVFYKIHPAIPTAVTARSTITGRRAICAPGRPDQMTGRIP